MEEEHVIPILEEELVAGKEDVKTGSVRVDKRIERIRKTARMPALKDVVKVSRVPINRAVEAMPEIRYEGDIVIVPVVEEEIVLHRRLMLKEEIHIHRSRTRQEVTKEFTLNKEHAVVERLDSEGRVVARSGSAGAPEPQPARRRPKSLFE